MLKEDFLSIFKSGLQDVLKGRERSLAYSLAVKESWVDNDFHLADILAISAQVCQGNLEAVMESDGTELVTEAALGEIEKSGKTVEVVLIREGLNTRGTHFYSREALEDAIESGLFLNKQVYSNHSKEGELPERELENLAGTITKVWGKESDDKGFGVHAIVEVARESIREILRHEPTASTIGMSINGFVEATPTREGHRHVTKFAKMRSVDFVTIPGAGGEIVEVLESDPDGEAQKTITKVTNRRTTIMDNALFGIVTSSVSQAVEAGYDLPEAVLTRVRDSVKGLEVGKYYIERASESGEGEVENEFLEESLRKDIEAFYAQESELVNTIKSQVEESAKADVYSAFGKLKTDIVSKVNEAAAETVTEAGKERIVSLAYSAAIEAEVSSNEYKLDDVIQTAIESEGAYAESLTKSGKPTVQTTESEELEDEDLNKNNDAVRESAVDGIVGSYLKDWGLVEATEA